MAVLEEATAGGLLLVADIDWSALPDDPFFADIRPANADIRPANQAASDEESAPLDLPSLLAGSDDPVQAVLELLRAHAAAVLGHETGETLAENASLLDLGLTSFTALELASRLRAAGAEVSAAVVFEYPTLGALARHLADGA